MQNTLSIDDAKQYIDDFKNCTSKSPNLWFKTLDSERSVYQWVSESYEVLINAEILDIPIYQISEEMTQQLKDNGLGHKVRYMREAIDPKYINRKYDAYQPKILKEDKGGVKLPLDSSTPDYSDQNLLLLDILERWDVSNKKVKEFLKKHPVELTQDIKFMDMLLSITSAIEEKSNYLTDDRQKVFKSDQIILQRIKEVATRNYCFDALIIEKMKLLKISSKQMGKILDLDIKEPFFTLRPFDEEQATQITLSGAQCEMCNTWRMKRKYNSDGNRYQDFCLDCAHWQRFKLSPTITQLN